MINLRINSSGSTETPRKLSPKITVIGVGGAGGNAVNNMINSGLEGVDFVVCNTDAQALEGNLAECRIQLGTNVTGGMGAGARPDIGKAAAEESIDEIIKLVSNANMVFITAGMGGGTGTGAAPVIARACRDLGLLTVGVVTKPFQFEGSTRLRMAEQGIQEMQEYVDTLIVIPNQNLFRIANEKTTFAEAFKLADSVLQAGVRSITDLIVREGQINLDFADVKSIMTEMGKAVMGTGEATGEKRALEAAEKAISNPLLDDVSMKGAKGVIINVTGGYDMTLYEVDEACNRVREEVDADANIIIGSTFDESLAGTMRISVIATGADKQEAKSNATTQGGISPGGISNVSPVGGLSSGLGSFGKIGERSLPKYQVPAAATDRQSAQQAPAQPAATQQPASDMFAGVDAPRPDVAPQQPVQQTQQQAVQPHAQPQQPLRGTLYKDAFIPPKPAEVDNNTSASIGLNNQSYNPAAVTNAPVQNAAFEPPPLNLTRPVSQPTYATPPLPSVAKGPAAETQMQPQAKKPQGLLGRLASGNWMPNLSRGHDAEDSFDSRPARQSEPQKAQAPVTSEAVASQGALNIDAPVKKTQASFEDELDIPAFLRRQAN